MIKYPTGYDIKAEQTENGYWRLLYIERFSPEDFEAFRASVELFKWHLPDATVELEEDRITVKLEDSREAVLGFLAGEFLAVSPLGRMQLNELLVSLLHLQRERPASVSLIEQR